MIADLDRIERDLAYLGNHDYSAWRDVQRLILSLREAEKRESGRAYICSGCRKTFANDPSDEPLRPVTVDYLEVLILRGWLIRRVNDHIEYRRPDGMSGSMYLADRLDKFPAAVWDWIVENIPRCAD